MLIIRLCMQARTGTVPFAGRLHRVTTISVLMRLRGCLLFGWIQHTWPPPVRGGPSSATDPRVQILALSRSCVHFHAHSHTHSLTHVRTPINYGSQLTLPPSDLRYTRMYGAPSSGLHCGCNLCRCRRFNLPRGQTMITLFTGLEGIIDTVTIDATTQPGFDTNSMLPVVTLKGELDPEDTFSGAGIYVFEGGARTTIKGTFTPMFLSAGQPAGKPAACLMPIAVLSPRAVS